MTEDDLKEIEFLWQWADETELKHVSALIAEVRRLKEGLQFVLNSCFCDDPNPENECPNCDTIRKLLGYKPA